MDHELDVVKRVCPQVGAPDKSQTYRQRSALFAAIERESATGREPRTQSGRSRRVRVATVFAAVGLVVGTGSVAVARTLFAPSPEQVTSVEDHYEAGRAAHDPGWRPVLEAEKVLCDYTAVSLPAGVLPTERVFGSASEYPLSQALTTQLLFDECRTRTDVARSVDLSPTAPVLCATSANAARALPVVLVGGGSCYQAGYVDSPAGLIDELNARREVEIDIRGVPGTCPTRDEAINWVNTQLDRYHQPLHLAEVPGGERCYLPTIDWQQGTVTISATVSSGNGPTNSTTPPSTP